MPETVNEPGASVAVVGAGIVGCAIALELKKRGVDVTLVDRDEPGRGCSFGNSGAISTSSIVPLAMPGVLASVPSMLLDAEGPLHLPLRYLPRALPWLLRFVASARPKAVEAGSARLRALHDDAIERHRALTAELGVSELFLQRGHLYLYPDERSLAKDATGWEIRRRHGFRCDRLDRAGLLALEPQVGERYRLGVFMPDQATLLDPFRYVQAMASAFERAGGRIVRAEVRSLARDHSAWRLDTAAALPTFGRVVVAAGAWSRHLLDPLGVRVSLESQRGYHVQYDGDRARATVSRTVVLADRKIFVTPMAPGLRVGGTVEIAGLDAPPDPRRSELLEAAARDTFAGLPARATSRWMGHRPCMPDSVPVIGPAPRQPGLWLAVGHGHLGLTDSINTGLRIADGMQAANLP